MNVMTNRMYGFNPVMVHDYFPLELHDGKSGMWLNDATYQTLFQKVGAWLLLSVVEPIVVRHYENKPIQIYWKFYHQKMKIFR